MLPTATAKGLQSVCIDSGLGVHAFQVSHGVVMIESSFVSSPSRTQDRTTMVAGWSESWDDFLTAKSIKGLGENWKTIYDRALEQAKYKRAENDARYFGVHLPAHEHWRLYESASPSDGLPRY